MTRDEQFFYDNAGWSYDPAKETPEQGRERTARSLAEAEMYAALKDWRYEWSDDIDGCIGCDCGNDDCPCSAGTPHETLQCVLLDADGKALAFLGAICTPSREYGRVIEAELADEAIHENQERLRREQMTRCFV